MLISRAPNTGHPLVDKQARRFARACDQVYLELTGRPNRLPQHPDCPVLAVSIDADFWVLTSNDPSFADLEAAATKLRRLRLPTAI